MCFFHLFRRKLTHDASRISMDDPFYYKSPCTTEEVNFHAEKYIGTYKLVSEKSFWGVVCKEGESVNIGNVQHQVCNPKQSPHMYCFTKTKTRSTGKVLFKVFKRNNDDWVLLGTQWYEIKIAYGVGCDCGWQLHQADDSNENRAGEQ